MFEIFHNKMLKKSNEFKEFTWNEPYHNHHHHHYHHYYIQIFSLLESTLLQLHSKYFLTKNEPLGVESISNSHRREINLL